MKKHFFYLSLSASLCLYSGSVFETWAGNSQKAYKKALLESMRACERIQSGYYDAVYRCKSPFREKEQVMIGRCIFSKVPTDQVLGGRVDLMIRHQDGTVTHKLYDGHYDVAFSSQEDRKARVSDLHQQQRTYYIAGSSAVGLLFKPLLPMLLFSKKEKYFFQQSIQKRAKHIHQLPNESIEGRPCSVFVVYCKDREEIKDEVLTLFVDHVLNVPIKYVHKATYWGSPTYEEATISNFTLRYQEDPSCVPDARALIPEGYEVIKDYAREYPKKTLLAVDTIAPLWTLPTVQGDELCLAALRGKVVLLSFWYKNFGPSLQYLQTLQKLHEKFQNQGLVVVGINLYDPREELTTFLQERGIAYPNLLGDEQVTKAYQAHTPNTFYLLDQSGKVCYVTIAQAQEDFPKKSLCKKINQLLKHNK